MHIVLVEPEIHWNTGNIGRTCVATATTLHLTGKLGFSLDAFLSSLPKGASLLFFSARAKTPFWDASYKPESYLIFGCESTGLSDAVLKKFKDRLYQIPIGPGVRSLNLSTAAAVALYAGLRRQGPHA